MKTTKLLIGTWKLQNIIMGDANLEQAPDWELSLNPNNFEFTDDDGYCALHYYLGRDVSPILTWEYSKRGDEKFLILKMFDPVNEEIHIEEYRIEKITSKRLEITGIAPLEKSRLMQGFNDEYGGNTTFIFESSWR